MTHDKKYYTKSELFTRGWTESAIKKWLKEPDLLKDNPYYKSSPPMKLYLIERVLEIEKSKEWKEWFEKSKYKRKKLSEKRKIYVKNKRKELLNYIDNLDIKIPKFELKKLFKMAVDHYNRLWTFREKFDKIIDEDIDNLDEHFLSRISVNMLRHEFTEYEYEIEKLFGRIGKYDGYLLLKKKIINKIKETYQEHEIIVNECNRQLSELEL